MLDTSADRLNLAPLADRTGLSAQAEMEAGLQIISTLFAWQFCSLHEMMDSIPQNRFKKEAKRACTFVHTMKRQLF